MAKIKTPSIYIDQARAMRTLKKQGFAFLGDSHNGVVFSLIDHEGYVQKRVVDLNGRVRSYKPYRPSTSEKSRLPKQRSRLIKDLRLTTLN